MRLASRLAILGILTGLAIPLLGVPPSVASSAVSTTVLVTQSNWYWSGQATNLGGAGISPPSPLTDPTVPAGDLAVAGPEQNGQPSKESYLEFDVSAIPAGSTISAFTITLPVDPSGTNVTPIGSQAPIIACTPDSNWAGGPGAQSFSGKPTDTCATSAPKVTTKDSGKTYTADIASIAQQWVQPGGNNFGVAITDDPQNTSTAYQVVFGPAAAISRLTASVTYVPPALSSAGGAATSGVTPGEANPGYTPGNTANYTPGNTANYTPNYTPNNTAGGAPSNPVTTPPTGNSSTSVPGPTRAVTAPTTGSLSSDRTGAAPPIGFWLAIVLLVLVLLAASAVLGDTPTMPAVKGARVARVLADRKNAGVVSLNRPVGHLTREL